MLPTEAFNEFTEGFAPAERIEVALYELVLNITFSNYSEVVEKLHMIIDRNGYLLSSLRRILNSRFHFMSKKVFNMLSDEFNLGISRRLDNLSRIFYEDDQSAFFEFLMGQRQGGYTKEDLNNYLVFAIDYDSVKILRFMISAGISESTLKAFALSSLMRGNAEIIRIFEHANIDYSKETTESCFKFIPNYGVSEWLLMSHHSELIGSPLERYQWSLLRGQRTLHSVGLRYDLPNLYFKDIDDNQVANDLPNLVNSDHRNILRRVNGSLARNSQHNH